MRIRYRSTPVSRILAFGVILAVGCRSARQRIAAELDGGRVAGQEIVVCGERFDVGIPVVLWSDSGGFDAYHPGPIYSGDGPPGLRYTPGRSWAAAGAELQLDDLRRKLDLLVMHYDACGFSHRCFRLLHDERVLSAHFMLDVDGTLYQTLDLRDQAWHGRTTNARSIGIEIAHIGVYAPDVADGDPYRKRRWYVRDGERLALSIPKEFGDPRILHARRFHSARNEAIRGQIHATLWEQADFTPEQYASLVKLTVALRRIFPRIALNVPRDRDGLVRTNVLSATELAAFQGILGHYHITTERNDPGPAFNWEYLLNEVQSREPSGATNASIPQANGI